MKKFTLLSAITVITFFANAQIKKGSVIPGGELGYSNSTYDYTLAQPQQKSSNANFNVSVGKAFKDNRVFGISVGYSHGTNNNYNSTNFESSKRIGYRAGVFYRRYKNITNDLYFFSEQPMQAITLLHKTAPLSTLLTKTSELTIAQDSAWCPV